MTNNPHVAHSFNAAVPGHHSVNPAGNSSNNAAVDLHPLPSTAIQGLHVGMHAQSLHAYRATAAAAFCTYDASVLPGRTDAGSAHPGMCVDSCSWNRRHYEPRVLPYALVCTYVLHKACAGLSTYSASRQGMQWLTVAFAVGCSRLGHVGAE